MRGLSNFCASAFSSLLLACHPAGRVPSGSDSGSASAPVWESASGSGSVPTPASASSDPYLTASPVAAKSIGHTSYVLKVTLAGGAKAAFKPRSRLPLGPRRYQGQIAAYPLAVALRRDNVPRALPRSFVASTLRGGEGFASKALVDADGRIRGALIPWIDQYRVLPLEQASWRAKWEPWLTDPKPTVPDEDQALAAAISTMIAFDYVTANWDRWSGANVAQDGATGELLYVDNDGAFYEAPPADALARQLALLRRVKRFSRRFVRVLRALDRAAIGNAFGEESPGVALLPGAVVDAVDARRQTVLRTIDARVAGNGDAATLAFP